MCGGCIVCFARGGTGPGDRGDPAWSAAAVGCDGAVVRGEAGARYEPGLLALREGALLEAAVHALPEPPDVLLIDATGRDHPRRAGVALQLGAVLDTRAEGARRGSSRSRLRHRNGGRTRSAQTCGAVGDPREACSEHGNPEQRPSAWKARPSTSGAQIARVMPDQSSGLG
jgi:hypothetical protein